MNANQILFLIVIIVFGTLVILSYIFEIKKIKNTDLLWGGVSTKQRKFFTFSMLLGAISFFIFSSYIFTLQGGNIDLLFIDLVYAILLCSAALWIPLMERYINTQKKVYWTLTRISLILVGFCSFILLGIVAFSGYSGIHFIFSVIGLSIFTFHTVVLDASVWPCLYTSSKR